MLTAADEIFINRRKLLALVVGIICVLVSIIAYQFSLSVENEKLHAKVESAGIQQRVKFQTSVSRTIELLNTVGSFIAQSEQLDRTAYASFTRPIIRSHPELWAIHWVPLVSDDERQAFEQQLVSDGFDGMTTLDVATNTVSSAPAKKLYYPILYSEPLERSHISVGFDTYSRQVNADVIDALLAGDQEYLGTAPFQLFEGASDILSLSYYRPVYDESSVGRGRLKGFVLAVIQPQMILNTLSSTDSDLVMKLYDVTPTGLVEVAATASSQTEAATVSYRSEFNILGRNWLLEVWDDRLQTENSLNISQWILIVGFLFSLCLVLMLLWLAKTHRQILLERDRAQSYLDTVETIMLMLDREGHIQMINRKGSEVLGASADDLLGESWFNQRTLVNSQQERQIFETLFDREHPVNDLYRGESRVRTSDGQIRLIAWRNRLSFDASGRPVGVLCSGVDITEQRQAELLDNLRSRAMEATLQGESLEYVLSLVVEGIEQKNPGALCSILLLDEQGQHLINCAASSLPKGYQAAIDGIEIGEGVGSCGTAVYRRERVIVTDIASDPLWADYKALALEHGLHSCWSEPIFGRKKRLIGTFAIYHGFISKPSHADLELIESVAAFVSLIIEQFQAEAALLSMANSDELTGLNNRRKLFSVLETEFERAKRYGHPFSLCMLDLDFFKKINDQYGHDIGDKVLQAVADTINHVLRENDVCGRIGGEEFAILLPDTALTSAAAFAERVRQAVGELALKLDDGRLVTLTCSIGVAEYSEIFHKASELLSCADQRLYYAKAHGRNCISTQTDYEGCSR
ncbi:sensor domain-containing diguanylate cyclase [Amphritea opalescens]|nr:diguanylate cyclase [Amphritea opalescens]